MRKGAFLRQIIYLVLFSLLWVMSVSVIRAEANPPAPPVTPVLGPADSTNSTVMDNHQIYNDLLIPNLPEPAQAADVADDGQRQEEPGRGVRQTGTGISEGDNLYAKPNVCNDFNILAEWTSLASGPVHYAGWGAYVVDDGGFYRADHVRFTLEQATGPGSKFGPNQHALKIAGTQPYAAGLGSPIITAEPGSVISVRVKYMIFDHDTQGRDLDWVSLGIKPDAEGEIAIFVNGLHRGEWTELVHSVVVGESGKVMVLLQAHSPAALNSNIYFDDLQIAVDGIYMTDCTNGS